MNKKAIFLSVLLIIIQVFNIKAQKNYFIDGYHGGVWGHYPKGYTTYISDILDTHPFWKINLEIEPETWDNARLTDPKGYGRLRQMATDQSLKGRIEFVNPAYGQSYLYNIQGESVIRQFELGIKKIRFHFPEAVFTTYSSEEPCFTSALPQILKSFGYSYASLKNPNTCWGGYTTAYGGELVRWTGPDGSSLQTVPRYASEKLLKGSTWQTIAWNNSKEYLEGATAQGISNPVGMCIQDAGWRNGPWLGEPRNFEYMTWRGYISGLGDQNAVPEWNFTQENVQVSLVWGAQILQKLARNTRTAENKLIMAEKLNAMQSVFLKKTTAKDQFDPAWQNLLLAQHHDSWIVPYNIVDKEKKRNWADLVQTWTGRAVRIADSILSVNGTWGKTGTSTGFRVFNTLAVERQEVVSVRVPEHFLHPVVYDASGKPLISQQVRDTIAVRYLLFKARVAPMGYSTYHIKEAANSTSGPSAGNLAVEANGKYHIRTDLYDITIDPAKGGTIGQLIARKLDNKEFVAKDNGFFNEMKGYFYSDSTWLSSADLPAKIAVVENGPLRTTLKIEGHIGIHPFTQLLSVTQDEARIGVHTKIDWKGNPGIGQDYNQKGQWKAEELKKAFYNDRFKLAAWFPLDLKQQKLYKNAAFDVLKSKLDNTYYNSWDSIKNTVIVNWVDVVQQDDQYGMALLTDHTTSYAHGEDGRLGLILQYSGMGLWGRNYSVKGPTEINYALLPHAGKWNNADLWTKSLKWNEPLQVNYTTAARCSESLFSLSEPGFEVSSLQRDGNKVLIRLFNASGVSGPVSLITGTAFTFRSAELVELDDKVTKPLAIKKDAKGIQRLMLEVPEFGIRTIRLYL